MKLGAGERRIEMPVLIVQGMPWFWWWLWTLLGVDVFAFETSLVVGLVGVKADEPGVEALGV